MDFLTILINNGIGVACAAAVLWFAWWREVHTIPNLTKVFTETQKVFTDAITTIQDRSTQRRASMLASFTELVREERTNYERWHNENRERLDKLFIEIKENRHYMKDLANQIITRQTIEDTRSRLRDTDAGKNQPKGN